MIENQEYISITFDLKPPKDVRHSIINTIVLLLSNIVNMEDCNQWDNIDTVIFNDNIEKIKKELDTLKIIDLKEE